MTENLALKNVFNMDWVTTGGIVKRHIINYPLDRSHVFMLISESQLREDLLASRNFEKKKIVTDDSEQFLKELTVLAVEMKERHGYTFNAEIARVTLEHLDKARFIDGGYIEAYYRTDKDFPIIFKDGTNALFLAPYADGADPYD